MLFPFSSEKGELGEACQAQDWDLNPSLRIVHILMQLWWFD